MDKIMTDFKGIRVISDTKDIAGVRKKIYGLLDEEGTWYRYELVEMPKWATLEHLDAKEALRIREERASAISDESIEFVGGFKVVRFADGKFSYMDEDGTIMPRRFDIAGNFNKFGLAMVADNGSVSWMDKNFRTLDYRWSEKEGKFIQDMTYATLRPSNGYVSLEAFDESSDYPLSTIELNWTGALTYYFLNTLGEIQTFTPFQELNDHDTMANVRIGFQQKPIFERGCSLVDNLIIFSYGKCLSIKRFIEILRESDIKPEEIIKKYIENPNKTKKHSIKPIKNKDYLN